jgi:hypothetical protein
MNPETIGVFIVCFIALIPAIDAVRRWSGKTDSRQISPQPLQVTAAPEFVTKEDCATFHKQQEEAFDRMISGNASDFRAILQQELRKMEELHAARTDEFRKELNSSIGGVHRRVDLIFRALKPGAVLDE